MLNHFNSINDELCSNSDMLFPFERPKRALYKAAGRINLSLFNTLYCQESFSQVTPDSIRISSSAKCVYLDGLWQNYRYFHEYSDLLYKSLDISNLKEYYLCGFNTPDPSYVAIHYRSYSEAGESMRSYAKGFEYYAKSISLIEKINLILNISLYLIRLILNCLMTCKVTFHI